MDTKSVSPEANWLNIIWRSILIFLLLAAYPGNVSQAAGKGSVFQETSQLAVVEQPGGSVKLGELNISSFPSIQFYLNLYDAKGQFLEGVKPEDLQVKEDEQVIRPDSVEKVQNGLQLIFVLNTGPGLATQVSGLSQYQRVRNALLDWVKQQNGRSENQAISARDDYSLATPTGLYLIRATTADQFSKAIQEYQPELAKSQPSLTSLAEALDLATDPLNGPHMGRAILYITPPVQANQKTALADLTSRAQKTGARVNVWMVGASSTSDASGSKPLQDLAQATGGQFSEIKDDPLPLVEPIFQPLRYTYRIAYTSSIQKSGQHHLSVQMAGGSRNLVSDSHSFSLDVQPPNPIFLSPPASIKRVWETGQDKSAVPTLAPADVPLQILIEFPDQHKRPIKTTRLYIDQKLAAENKQEPFDRFSWSIADLETPGRHMLRVEAVDSLGVTGASSEIPVDILIEQPARASLFDHISSQGVIAVAAVIIAGGALVLILVLSNRRRLGRRGRMGAGWMSASDKKRLTDPVTQPVKINNNDISKPRKGNEPVSRPAAPHAAWPAAWAKTTGQNAPARLVALDENEQPITGGVILLARQEITFGSDPRRATQLLESPTVDGLHARLYRTAEDCFFLADQNSVAGTWINFAPVPTTGQPLENGDLIHIGRMMFRFEMIDPSRAAPAKIKVIDLEK